MAGESIQKARIIGILGADLFAFPASEPSAAEDLLWREISACDMLELRIDLFPLDKVPLLLAGLAGRCRDRLGRSLPLLLTARLERDGGRWKDGNAPYRIPYLRWLAKEIAKRKGQPEGYPASGASAAVLGAEIFLDVEIEARPEMRPEDLDFIDSLGWKLLLSHHDFSGSPGLSGLLDLARRMEAFSPAALKFAVLPKDEAQVLDLLRFAARMGRERKPDAAGGRPVCVIGMGEAGTPSRLLAPLLGCPWTYGFLGRTATAPGQIKASALRAALDRASGLEEPADRGRENPAADLPLLLARARSLLQGLENGVAASRSAWDNAA